jgi:hypothetical protein
MVLKKFSTAICLVLLFGNTAFSSEWVVYENARFGTQAEIPSAGFEALSTPANDDGQRWVPHDGVGTFAIFGSFLVVSDDLAGYEALHLEWAREEGIDVTYSVRGDGWFVLSGLKGGSIVYRRYELSAYCGAEIVDGFTATYPMYVRDIFDPIISHISLSLGNSKNGLEADC